MTKKSELRRYTSLPALLRILRASAITLLPPNNWDDKNDRELMKAYADATKSKTCLALCFAQAAETYHHWKVFSPGSDGVCIVFNKDKLTSQADANQIKHGSVEYRTLNDVKSENHKPTDLPFLKRSAYKDEREYRFLFSSQTETCDSKYVAITPDMINRIIVNPWLPVPLYEATSETISAIAGFEDAKISQSTVIDSPGFKELAKKYLSHPG